MPIKNTGTKVVDDRILKRNRAASLDNSSNRWWKTKEGQPLTTKEDKADVHKWVWPVAERIQKNMAARMRQNFIYALTYNDIDTNLYAAQSGSPHNSAADSSSNNRITLNVVQNAIDTAASIIATNKPRPKFMADSGNYEDIVKAEQLTRYVQGVIDDIDLYSIRERCFTDGGIYGTGAIKYYIDEDEKKIKADWVYIPEIMVDDLDGSHEKPTQLHQWKYVSRDILCEQFPEHEEQIMSANNNLRGEVSQKTMVHEVKVLESWHLKSGKSAKDGLHTIVLPDCTLLCDKYDADYYPLSFWRWYHQSIGFWGRGIVQEGGKIQRTINKLSRTIDLCQELLGVPVIISPKTAMITEDHIMNNEIGHWIEYFGDQGPQFLTPPAVAAELYSYQQFLIQMFYQTIGVNQSMAGAGTDPHLESRPAIQEATDVASGRLQRVAQRWEEWMTKDARIIVDLSRELYKLDKDLAVVANDQNGIVKIKWKDVDMEDDKFKIKCFEVSGLPSTPQGKIDFIGTMGAAIPQPIMMEMIGIDPNIDDFTHLIAGTFNLVRSQIAAIKKDGEMTSDLLPIDHMDAQLAKNVASQEYVVAKLQGISNETLNLIDSYIGACDRLIQQQMPPPAPAPPPGPMPPPGPPQMPPPQQ